MHCRALLTVAAASLALGACAVAPRGELLPEAESIRLVAEKPAGRFEELDRITGYGGPGCGTQSGFDGSRERAFISLRNKAAVRGATHVRVLGTGDLESRGGCIQDQYQVTGIALRAIAAAPENLSPTAPQPPSGESPADADQTQPGTVEQQPRSTADKLTELIELRERGLISEQEYQQLRDQVLESRFGG
jgi:hypothetical protein